MVPANSECSFCYNMQELMKHTAVDHPDHRCLGEALTRLHKELTKLNLSIKSCQMACPSGSRKGTSFLFKGGSAGRRRIVRKTSRTFSALKK